MALPQTEEPAQPAARIHERVTDRDEARVVAFSGSAAAVPATVTAVPLALDWQWRLKRLIDVVVSLGVLIVLSPLIVALVIAIKLDSPGPVLYVQERVGRHGRRFKLLKFRSMRVDAEAATGPVFARPNDPRTTRVGRVMRRSSLDELPQFVNVLRGEMSVVGPRPERPHFVRQFSQAIPHYMERHAVQAGITGWAQVKGLRGGGTPIEERTRHDLAYVGNWSLWLDLKIILLTVRQVLSGENAY